MGKSKVIAKGMTSVLLLVACGASLPAKSSEPMTCEVTLKSQKGGEISVVTIDKTAALPIDVPIQISWAPSSSNQSIDLHIKYEGSDLTELKSPSGGYARFHVPNILGEAELNGFITTKNGERWQFSSQEIATDGKLADLMLSADKDNGRAVLNAIASGSNVTIEILNKKVIILSSSFNISAEIERNRLLREASNRLKTDRDRICRPI